MTAKLFRGSDVSWAAVSVHTWCSQRRDNVAEADTEGVFESLWWTVKNQRNEEMETAKTPSTAQRD